MKSGRIQYFLKTVYFCFVLFYSLQSKAGNEGFVFGPRALATGQSGLMHTDVWANHNNIGALGWLNSSSLGVSFDNRYNLSSLNQISFAGAAVSKKYGVFGLGLSRFGSEIFNQSRGSLGWSKAFGIASIGIQGQWYQVAATDFPTKHQLVINFGGLAKLTSKLHFGASISNLNQAKASEFQNERIPTIVRAGLTYIPNDKIRLVSEVQKDLDQKSIVKIGIEYEVLKKVWIRTGFSSQIEQVSGGLGVEWRNFQFQYAIANHPQLGWSNSLGINFLLAKNGDPKQQGKSQKEEK